MKQIALGETKAVLLLEDGSLVWDANPSSSALSLQPVRAQCDDVELFIKQIAINDEQMYGIAGKYFLRVNLSSFSFLSLSFPPLEKTKY